jgi:uncharacterized protein (DUF2235 family)
LGRKIVLLSDGTGNSAAKVWRTNVWRVFESIDLSTSDQIAAYDDGVGTSSFKPLAIFGGAFGYGLKRNVIDLYKFACRNYRSPEDEIFAFGFSRGAFTIRVVIGLILEQGIIRANSEAELNTLARAAYRDFRRRNFHTFWRFPEAIARAVRDFFIRTDYSKDRNFHSARIRFLGLWDTVAAYGMPIEEMTRGVSQWLFPLLLPRCDLDPRVVRACHALSIDDERTTFHPVLWDERSEAPLAPRADGTTHLVDERISQVWFAGVHSNVGGGYPDDSLAQIPLIWIMNEAEKAGLVFKSIPAASPQTIEHPETAQDKDGRLYDPRKGLGGYYRYGPRRLTTLGHELLARGGGKVVPKIHETVLARVKNYAHLYSPVGLPADYALVTPAGEVLTPAQNSYEAPAQALARSRLQEKVWNFVWLRRIVYFLTVGVSVYLAAFPLIKARPPTDELGSPLRWVSDIVRLAGSVLPGAFNPWINGYARDPIQFLIVVATLIVILLIGARISGRIQNQMGMLWRQSLGGTLGTASEPNDFVYRLRTHPWYRAAHHALKRYIMPAFFAILFLYVGLAIASHALYNVQDYAGWVCRDTDKTRLAQIAPGQTIRIAAKDSARFPLFRTSDLCRSMGVWLERNAKYLVVVKAVEPFTDDVIEASKGFYSWEPPSLAQKLAMVTAVPVRRELIRPWFRMVARFGGKGGEETFLDPDPKDGSIAEVITATRDGELFMFVNDAVLPIPGLYGYFYSNNTGTAEITITRQKPCFVCEPQKP